MPELSGSVLLNVQLLWARIAPPEVKVDSYVPDDQIMILEPQIVFDSAISPERRVILISPATARRFHETDPGGAQALGVPCPT